MPTPPAPPCFCQSWASRVPGQGSRVATPARAGDDACRVLRLLRTLIKPRFSGVPKHSLTAQQPLRLATVPFRKVVSTQQCHRHPGVQLGDPTPRTAWSPNPSFGLLCSFCLVCLVPTELVRQPRTPGQSQQISLGIIAYTFMRSCGFFIKRVVKCYKTKP